MISQTAEYALRAIVYLAMNPGNAYTAQQISATTQVPTAYLSKVLKSMVRAGLVRSQRGVRGGFILSRLPQEVSILEVVSSVEPVQRMRNCPLGFEAHDDNLCALHRRLDEAAAVIEATFAGTTIAEVLSRPAVSIALPDAQSARERGPCPFN